MDEEVIDYLYKWALSDGFKRSKEDFVNLLQKDDEVLSYAFEFAQKDGFKKDKNALGALVGRTTTAAPVATTEPAKTEVVTATTEPAKIEVATTTTTPAKTEPAVTVAAETAPAKTVVVAETKTAPAPVVVAETKVEPQITVKEVEAPVKEEPKKELPVSTGLTPITEKTEVKAIETPSDKMVIKSEKKGKMKVAPEPIKIEPIKVETKGGQIQVEVPTFAIPEPKKKYKPYGDKGPDVYYSEDFDQYIIKEGDSKILVDKGSDKYEEIDKKIGETVKGTIEGTGKCDRESGSSCSLTQLSLNDFLSFNDNEAKQGKRTSTEGSLIYVLDEIKYNLDNANATNYELWEGNDRSQIWYANDELPKDKRFVVYKPYGDDNTLIYDKDTGIILKQLNEKVPYTDKVVSYSKTIDENKIAYQNYKKNNPNEGMNLWYGYERDRPGYKELKSIIEGIDYKKAKGSKNTFIPSFNPVPETPDWQKQ